MERFMVILCMVCLAVALVSCASKGAYSNKPASEPRVAGTMKTTSLCCWFVEEGPDGQRGYVAVDGRVSFHFPDHGGFFSSIKDLREGIKRQGIPVVHFEPDFGNVVPDGWKIRSLTKDELDQLRKP